MLPAVDDTNNMRRLMQLAAILCCVGVTATYAEGTIPYQDHEASQTGSQSASDRPSPPQTKPQAHSPTNAKKPHIVMIVADDLGWNDVDWRDGSLHTPVLSALASRGVILTQSYVQPVCSPSRAAFMSGFYPYHMGLQHDSLRATQKAYLPDNVTTLPQHLQQLGYHTHMAGKWHLGFCNWRYTPTYRGFHSFVGFYNAIQDYYTHVGHHNGYDFRYNEKVFSSAKGTYSAFIFTQYMENVIAQHNVTQPLFLYLPYQSVHGPLQVPQDYIDSHCSHIKDEMRRSKCGMIAALDEGVGNVTRALQARGLLDNTLLLFTTDNGGPVTEGANNWPLRGSKHTLWEGGTRAMAFLYGPRILGRNGTTYEGMIHAVDWLPTLVEAAGGRAPQGLDGVSQWQSLLQDTVPSARTEFLYNMDELKNNSALRQGRYKLLQGHPGHPSGWYPPRKLHNESQYPFKATPSAMVKEDNTPLAKQVQGEVPQGTAEQQLISWFSVMNISDHRQSVASLPWEEGKDVLMPHEDITGKDQFLLYDLEADPLEHHDLKDKLPDVFQRMRARLAKYRKTLVPANFPPHDPDALPSHFNGVWSPGWC